jgi:nucleoside 2-deoxyribosyltransferase
MNTIKYKPKVYLSGGFKSNWQEKVIGALGNNCTFFNPRAHQLESDKEYWVWDMHFVKECDLIFAYMESDNPSGFGLTFEIGLAYALNKTIILIDEKSNIDKDFERYFKIVSNSTRILYNNLDEGINYLKKFTALNDSIK